MSAWRMLLAFTMVFIGINASAAERSINLVIAPVGIAVDSTRLGADFVIMRNLSLGVRYSYIDSHYKDIRADGEAFSVLANLSLSQDALNGGFYVTPEIVFPNYAISAEVDGDEGSVKLTDLMYRGLIGYQWIWEHFNINIAGGVRHISQVDSISVRRADGSRDEVKVPGFMPDAEITFGWAF